LPLCTIIIKSHFGIRDGLDALVNWGDKSTKVSGSALAAR
jgi:hypothetical protein